MDLSIGDELIVDFPVEGKLKVVLVNVNYKGSGYPACLLFRTFIEEVDKRCVYLRKHRGWSKRVLMVVPEKYVVKAVPKVGPCYYDFILRAA